MGVGRELLTASANVSSLGTYLEWSKWAGAPNLKSIIRDEGLALLITTLVISEHYFCQHTGAHPLSLISQPLSRLHSQGDPPKTTEIRRAFV